MYVYEKWSVVCMCMKSGILSTLTEWVLGTMEGKHQKGLVPVSCSTRIGDFKGHKEQVDQGGRPPPQAVRH
jgi:hypothetical protein